MRRILLLVLLITFGCAPPNYIPESLSVSGINFAPFSEKGFLFTPNKYLDDYESIGIINLSFAPEANLIRLTENTRNGERTTSSWVVNDMNPDSLLIKVHELCVEMGADALTEFEVTSFYNNHAVGTTNPITIMGIKFSGFAIRRKWINTPH